MSMDRHLPDSEGIAVRRALPTGIQGLDDISNGGFPRRRLYLVQGDPGVGKTTMAMAALLLEGVQQGERGPLHHALGEADEELRGVAAAHGWELDGLDLFHLRRRRTASTERHNYTIFQPSEVELGEATKMLLAEVERVQPTRGCARFAVGDAPAGAGPAALPAADSGPQTYFAERGCTVRSLDDTSETGDLQLAEPGARRYFVFKHDTPVLRYRAAPGTRGQAARRQVSPRRRACVRIL